jgi:hypothetical protein
VDPEGDHRFLAQRPSVVCMGAAGIPLPAAAALPRLLRAGVSVVLEMGGLDLAAQVGYVDEVLGEIETAQALTGLPQWVIVDEAHYFFHEQAPSARRLRSRTGNAVFVTYRPSLLSSDVAAGVGAYVITSTTVDEERYFITSLLRARGPRDLAAGEALRAVEVPHGALLLEQAGGSEWQVFRPGGRQSEHAHHARKYAEKRLPPERAFRFLFTGDGPMLAANVAEFHAAIRNVSVESLQHHLRSRDFSRWAEGVLGDLTLARGLRKLERTLATGAAPNRGEVLALIETAYEV